MRSSRARFTSYFQKLSELFFFRTIRYVATTLFYTIFDRYRRISIKGKRCFLHRFK